MPLVSYQTNRLLSGWILPPPVIRALGAHSEVRDLTPWGALNTAVEPIVDAAVALSSSERH